MKRNQRQTSNWNHWRKSPESAPEEDSGNPGECKDQGPINQNEFRKDIDNLRRVAESFLQACFKLFILLIKLNPFTPEEINLAKTQHTEDKLKAILLTAREPEPHHVFERTKAEFEIDSYGGSPEAMEQVPAKIYFYGGQCSSEQ